MYHHVHNRRRHHPLAPPPAPSPSPASDIVRWNYTRDKDSEIVDDDNGLHPSPLSGASPLPLLPSPYMLPTLSSSTSTSELPVSPSSPQPPVPATPPPRPAFLSLPMSTTPPLMQAQTCHRYLPCRSRQYRRLHPGDMSLGWNTVHLAKSC